MRPTRRTEVARRHAWRAGEGEGQRAVGIHQKREADAGIKPGAVLRHDRLCAAQSVGIEPDADRTRRRRIGACVIDLHKIVHAILPHASPGKAAPVNAAPLSKAADAPPTSLLAVVPAA